MDILKRIGENDKWILKEIVQNYFINKARIFENIDKNTQAVINKIINKK